MRISQGRHLVIGTISLFSTSLNYINQTPGRPSCPVKTVILSGTVKQKKEKMKKFFTFIIILMALTACSTPQTQVPTDTPATDMPQAGMPNPASVYCEQNGNKLEIRTAADGSQSGVCIFPDGSTCDEWAYFRGECGRQNKKSNTCHDR